MPYSEDGTQFDMLLNPIGVPSRMNIGQILETHLGAASKNIGKQIAGILEKVASEKSKFIESLRSKLLSVYSLASEVKKIKAMEEQELIEFA